MKNNHNRGSFQNRLNDVIPGGAHTYSRGSDQFSANAPSILMKGKGAYVWDEKGKKILDFGMALRACTLGYSNKEVNHSAFEQIANGNNLTKPSIIELDAAEALVDLIPGVDMVKFAKNGSNAVTAAVKIARSYTGKKYICVPNQHPFFSFDDWFIGSTVISKGVPSNISQLTLKFDYNNLDSLKALFSKFPNDIAAVVMEPATTLVPKPFKPAQLKYKTCCKINGLCKKKCEKNSVRNYLNDVKKICQKYNSLFVLDEMITGFRWHLKGAQTYFSVKPDICTFGKGMANGFSVAALCGKKEIMKVGSTTSKGEERTFLLSTTHGGEMSSLGAFLKTLQIYKRDNVCQQLWDIGGKIRNIFKKTAENHNLQDHIYLDGPDILLNFVTLDQNKSLSANFRTLLIQEMIKNDVLMPWISPSVSHSNKELKLLEIALESSFKIYKKALEDDISSYLIGDPVKPVFRKYN